MELAVEILSPFCVFTILERFHPGLVAYEDVSSAVKCGVTLSSEGLTLTGPTRLRTETLCRPIDERKIPKEHQGRRNNPKSPPIAG